MRNRRGPPGLVPAGAALRGLAVHDMASTLPAGRSTPPPAAPGTPGDLASTTRETWTLIGRADLRRRGRRSRRPGMSPPPTARSTPAWSRPASSAVTMGARRGPTCRPDGAPVAAAWQPGTVGSSSTRSSPRQRPPPDVGRDLVRRGRSRRATEAPPGSTATAACGRLHPDPHPVFGQCVHKLLAAAGEPETLYQQKHCGVYRSDDGGLAWTEITPACPPSSASPWSAIRGTRPRRGSSPSTAPTRPLMPDAAAASGGPGTAAPAGTPGTRPAQEHAYSASCGRRWRGSPRPGRVAFGTGSGELWTSADEGAAGSRQPPAAAGLVGRGPRRRR